MMSKAILLKLEDHETEDKNSIQNDWKATLQNEYANAQDLLQATESWRLEQLTPTNNFQINTTLIRTASNFNIRKHTAYIPAYYHSHDFYELIYVLRGTCRQYFYGDKTCSIMEQDQACLLAPGVIHAIEPSNSHNLILKLVIPKNVFEPIGGQLRMNHASLSDLIKNTDAPFFLTLSASKKHTSDFVLTQLLDELFFNPNYQSCVVKSYLTIFFSHFQTSPSFVADKTLLQQTMKHIQSSIEDASIESFAASLGYSIGHLQRLIREKTGGSFTDILQRVKVEQASQLLSDTDLSIELIAEQLGYQNASGLHKIFVSLYGMTPGNYRKLHRNTSN